MLESYFERLRTSVSLVRPAYNILPFVNYKLLCASIMNLNRNEYKVMNVIRNYNNKNICCALLEFQLASIHNRRDVYEVDVVSTSLDSAYFFWCRRVSTRKSIETV